MICPAGHRRGEIQADNGFLGLTGDRTVDEVTDPDVVIIPGGTAVLNFPEDETFLGWIRTAAASV